MEQEFEARVGDEIAVESHRLRGSRRVGTILEVLGAPGHEYYRVQWQDGHETVFHPGADVVLVKRTPRRRRRAAAPPRAPARAAAQPAAEPPGPGIRAEAGDRLVIRGHHLGEPDRDAEILEVLGENGGPPYRVRWSETGREALLFPGTDAVVDHIAHRPKRRQTRNA